ncbi:MAG: hypothetical protein JOZ89_10145 [Gammaproteobacteria bacterium]|nr:hypothetical protein [Gammaproteobacteria bacterium]
MANKMLVAALLAGLVGGIAGAWLATGAMAGSTMLSAAVASTRAPEVVAAGRLELVDARGKIRAELAMSADGGPALFFYDSAARNRLVVGLYSPAEGEAPSVVLNDVRQQAAGIFRLFGASDTPVVVLKHQGRDRSVYGLNPGSADPFLTNYRGDGSKSEVFGHF